METPYIVHMYTIYSMLCIVLKNIAIKETDGEYRRTYDKKENIIKNRSSNETHQGGR